MDNLKNEIAALKASPLFDKDWYVAEYADVAALAMDPVEHYLTIGARILRNPSTKFDTQNYLMNNPDVAAAGINPLLHYVIFGKKEGRTFAAPALAPSPAKPAIKSAEVPAAAASAPAKSFPKIKGSINRGNDTDAVIRGWVAEIGSPAPRKAVLIFDHNIRFEVEASSFRADLKKNLINEGRHAFELVVPQEYIDGKPHHVQLLDAASGKQLGQADLVWRQSRRFKDFTGFLADSFVSPTIGAPFREEDKRCFAAMENVARSLVEKSKKAERAALVSIIMPVHNRLQTLQAAVDSVLTQTYKNIELVIIDDGSTDGSVELVESFTDKRIKFKKFAQCQGVSAARNEGLQLATGRYIAYLDSDNTWDERYVAAMVGAFVELPAASAVYSGQVLYRGNQKKPFAIRFGSFNRSLVGNRNYIDLNAFCHTREILKKVKGFDTNLRRYVDWDLIMRISEVGSIFSVPVILSNYFYEKAENTITANDAFTQYLDIVRQNRLERLRARNEANQKPLSKPVAVIIPSYEALDDLKECVESVFQHGPKSNLEVIVVDNASSEPVVSYLRGLHEQKLIKFVENKINYGFTHAVNLGIAAANPKSDIVLLNNDALMTAGAIEALQKASYNLNNCGLVVPQQILPGGTKTIVDHVPFANPAIECDVNISYHHANIVNPPLFSNGEVTEISFAPFFCVYIKRKVLALTGNLDAEHGRHYRSDRIYCDYIRHILGMRIYHVADAVVYHKLQKATDGLRSKKGGDAEFDLMFRQNKWGALAETLGFREAPWDI